MKTLSVQQPFASLICAGIKDIENRSWSTSHRGKILIMASSKKITNSTYDGMAVYEWLSEFYMEKALGSIPANDKEFPTSAIIGYVTVEDCVDAPGEAFGIWGDGSQYKWKLSDAYMFDEPITGVKGKLNLWDYPDIDENNLPPAHQVELLELSFDGSALTLPFIDSELDAVLSQPECERYAIVFDAPTQIDSLKAEHGKDFFEHVKKVVYQTPTRTVAFEAFEVLRFSFPNEKGQDIMLPSVFGGEESWGYFGIKLGKQVKA